LLNVLLQIANKLGLSLKKIFLEFYVYAEENNRNLSIAVTVFLGSKRGKKIT
jgi:hypothetical protein